MKSKFLPVFSLTVLLTISFGVQGIAKSPRAKKHPWLDNQNEDQCPCPTPTRSPGIALALSLGSSIALTGTSLALLLTEPGDDALAAGISIGSIGLIMGPSAGHVYTGDWKRLTWMSLGRLALGGVAAFGFGAHVTRPCYETGTSWGKVMFYTGLAGVVGLAIWDIVDSPYSAHRFNETHSQNRFAVSPMILPPARRTDENATGFGLAFSASF